MQLRNAVSHFGEALLVRFDDQENFVRGLHLALPAINAVNQWENIHASSESRFDEGIGDAQRLIVRAASTEDDHQVCHEDAVSLDLSSK
jgi:hypothetical protein